MAFFSVLHGQERKKVRGPTKKTSIFARQNKPKIEVVINDRGQPCGKASTEFSNFIGTFVRTKGFSLAAADWRKVDARHKYKLWTDAQVLKFLYNYYNYKCVLTNFCHFIYLHVLLTNFCPIQLYWDIDRSLFT